MSRKALQRKLKTITTNVPELVGHYKSATRKIFGVRIDVAHHTYDKFRERSEELEKLNISLRDYSYGIITILKSWVIDKKLRQLPTNVFLGKWALEKYRNVHESEFVNFHYDDGDISDLLQTELIVARYYIESASKKFIRYMDCVEELRSALNEEWLALYDAGDTRLWLMSDALEILEEEYGIRAIKYIDIIDAKVLNG